MNTAITENPSGNIKKLQTSDLNVGMYVHKVESSIHSTEVMFDGYKITSQQEIQTLIDYGIETVYIDTSMGIDVEQSATGARKSPNKLKALVVDDSRIIRQIEISVFAAIGNVDVDEAVDGFDALKKLTDNKYDIVLLDWMMPGMTGEQVLREIRGVKGPNKNTPVLMVTSEVDRKKIITVATLGISGYITKAFTNEVLEAKIRGVLEKLNEKALAS